jgi:hypothetical protein
MLWMGTSRAGLEGHVVRRSGSRSARAVSRERTFDEWLADIDTMAGLGYRPILTALQHEDGFEVYSPALGPDLATTVSQLASDLEAGPPPELGRIRHARRGERDEAVMAFVDLLDARRAAGSLPYYILFANDAGRLHSLTELGIEELPGFLRWLSFEVAKGAADDEMME